MPLFAAGTDTLKKVSTGDAPRAREASSYSFGTASSAKTPDKDGAFARRADGVTKTLLSGLGHYKGFAFDDKGTQLSFLSDREAYKDNPATYRLYHWQTAAEAATAYRAAIEALKATSVDAADLQSWQQQSNAVFRELLQQKIDALGGAQ